MHSMTWDAATGLLRRLVPVSVLFCVCLQATGCNANDPRLNPKARASAVHYTARAALRPYDPMGAYERETVRWRNPRTGHEEEVHVYVLRGQQTLPERFAVAFDEVDGRVHLRTDGESSQNIDSLAE